MTSEQKVKQVYPKAYWSDHRICSPLENGLPFKVEIYLSSRLTVPRGTNHVTLLCRPLERLVMRLRSTQLVSTSFRGIRQTGGIFKR
jgi:hypothetical protein